MKVWVALGSVLDDLEQERRRLNANINFDAIPDFTDLDKSPVPVFQFGHTGQNSTVFFNYNYLLRGGRRVRSDVTGDTDLGANTLRYFIFRSDDLLKNRSTQPMGYLDLIVDNRNKVRDVLGVKRAFVEGTWLQQGIREEILSSLMKTVEHYLTVHTVDDNVLHVLQNLKAVDPTTNGEVTLSSSSAVIPYVPEDLENRVRMSTKNGTKITTRV